jgi:hypothetical protein
MAASMPRKTRVNSIGKSQNGVNHRPARRIFSTSMSKKPIGRPLASLGHAREQTKVSSTGRLGSKRAGQVMALGQAPRRHGQWVLKVLIVGRAQTPVPQIPPSPLAGSHGVPHLTLPAAGTQRLPFGASVMNIPLWPMPWKSPMAGSVRPCPSAVQRVVMLSAGSAGPSMSLPRRPNSDRSLPAIPG